MAAPKKNKLLNLVPTTEDEAPIEKPKKSVLQIAQSLRKNQAFKEHNTIKMASELKSPEVIPTGILGLDHALNIGGFPRGKIIQIYGNGSSWKSTICLRTIAEAQKLGGEAVWFDAESSFDPNWARINGVDLEHLLVISPDTQEDALNTIEDVAREGVAVVVLDSLAALSPHKEKYTSDNKREFQPLDKEQMGVFAKVMAKFFRRSVKVFGDSGSLFLIVNQLRSSLSPYGSPTSVPGGRALAFFNTISINMKKLTAKDEQVLDEDKNVIGGKYQFTVDKTRYGLGGVSGVFTVKGTEIDNFPTLRDIAIREGFVQKLNASAYMVNGVKIVGKDNVTVAFENDAVLAATIEEQIRSKMGFNVTRDIKAATPVAADETDEDLDQLEALAEEIEAISEELNED